MAGSTTVAWTPPVGVGASSERGVDRYRSPHSMTWIDGRVANPPDTTMMSKDRRIAGGTSEPASAGRTSKGCRVASPHTGKVE
jgi:hypothetical protein